MEFLRTIHEARTGPKVGSKYNHGVASERLTHFVE